MIKYSVQCLLFVLYLKMNSENLIKKWNLLLFEIINLTIKIPSERDD